jgi:hypothetical protein
MLPSLSADDDAVPSMTSRAVNEVASTSVYAEPVINTCLYVIK